jgi:hypothetical protein
MCPNDLFYDGKANPTSFDGLCELFTCAVKAAEDLTMILLPDPDSMIPDTDNNLAPFWK